MYMKFNLNLVSASTPIGCSVLASRKMITIEDEEDLPDHLQNCNFNLI